MSLLRYYSLHSNYFDLGIFQSNLNVIWVENEWQRAFTGHVQPLLLVLSFFYNFFGTDVGTVLIFVFQVLAITSPVICLQKKYGALVSLVYMLFYGVWYNALFDFHVDSFIIPLMFAFYFYVDKKKYNAAVVTALLIMFIKEPFALVTIGCGLYLFVSEKRWYQGLLVCLLGASYFYISTSYILPYFSLNHQTSSLDSSAYSWMGKGIFDIVTYIITNPVKIIEEMFSSREKFLFLLIPLASVSFISLLRPVVLLPAVPAFAMALLSKVDTYYTYANHYSASLIAPLIIGFALAYSSIDTAEKFKKYIVASILVVVVVTHVVFSPSLISRFFWTNKISRLSYSSYIPNSRDLANYDAIKRYIPDDRSIVVSTQNSVNNAFLANRSTYLAYPLGVTSVYAKIHESKISELYADYIVLDLSRPWYLVDRGCEWLYGKCENKSAKKEFLLSLKSAEINYSNIYLNDNFYIYKRKQ